MKIKFLFIMSLLLATVSCSKEKPVGLDMEDDTLLNSVLWGGNASKMQTPKGWVDVIPVDRKNLPDWLIGLTEGIHRGYIMKGGIGNDRLYFVYDNENDYGRYYDIYGNPTSDNPDLTNWTVIYHWNQSPFQLPSRNLTSSSLPSLQ